MTIVAGPQSAVGRLEVIVPDGDQVPVVYRDRDRGQINLAAGQRQRCSCTPRADRSMYPSRSASRPLPAGQWTRDLPSLAPKLSTQEFVVGIGPPIGLDDAVATIRRRAEAAIQAAQVMPPKCSPIAGGATKGSIAWRTTSDARFLGPVARAAAGDYRLGAAWRPPGPVGWLEEAKLRPRQFLGPAHSWRLRGS